MSLPLIFVFAPVPLTGELSPLAHAAGLARRHQEEMEAITAAKRGSKEEKKAGLLASHGVR